MTRAPWARPSPSAWPASRADPTLRALVLTGSGRAFSAGGDLEMIAARSAEARERPGLARRGVRDFMRAFYGLFLAVRRLPCPTIAAVNGPAIGAGFCVALACDMRLVAREARVGLNFTRLGLSPGMGATWTLPRLVGPALAAELLYSSRLLDGEEAARRSTAPGPRCCGARWPGTRSGATAGRPS